MIVLITPTGARYKQIKLCARWMSQQRYEGEVLWIIVDDALPRSTDFIPADFRENWNILKVYPTPPWEKGQNTQARNIHAGIQAMRSFCDMDSVTAIFIIEDDDYYSPNYLARTAEQLKGYDLCGELLTIYYNVASRSWMRNGNRQHSSLFQTAFTPAAIPMLEQCWQHKYIDCNLFNLVQNKHLFMDGDLAIGIKGQDGRGGIGMGHSNLFGYQPDPKGIELYNLIGHDVIHYINDWNSCNIPN